MITKRVSIFIHFFGAAIFILMAFLASPDWPDVREMLANPMGLQDFIFQLEMLLFFYMNYCFFIGQFYFRKKYISYFLIIVACYILFVPITWLLIKHNFNFQPEHHAPFFKRKPSLTTFFFNRKLYLFLLILVFSLLLKIWERLKLIQEEKTVTELSFLKSQINPHFLFNTLNSIYSLSLQNSAHTPDAIIKLSSMMRYVLKDTQDDFVNLKDEINYISNFIELQKLRLDEYVKFSFKIDGELADQKIAPMLLIPFIENAFKYGVNAEEESNIDIFVEFSKVELTLKVVNTKVKTSFSKQSTTRLGLFNAQKRLDLLYPKAHNLHIEDGEKEYKVNLTLKIK